MAELNPSHTHTHTHTHGTDCLCYTLLHGGGFHACLCVHVFVHTCMCADIHTVHDVWSHEAVTHEYMQPLLCNHLHSLIYKIVFVVFTRLDVLEQTFQLCRWQWENNFAKNFPKKITEALVFVSFIWYYLLWWGCVMGCYEEFCVMCPVLFV